MVAVARRFRRRPRRPKPIPSRAVRRIKSVRPPAAIELFMVQAAKRFAAAFAEEVRRAVQPLLDEIAAAEWRALRLDQQGPKIRYVGPKSPHAYVVEHRDGHVTIYRYKTAEARDAEMARHGLGRPVTLTEDGRLATPPISEVRVKETRAEMDAAATRAVNRASILGPSDMAARRLVQHVKVETDRLGLSLVKAEPKWKPLLDSWTRDNVSRVRGMADDQLDKIERVLTSNLTLRHEELADEIERQLGDVTRSRAELIARDQVLTLNAKITRERQTACGVERFVWTTSGDERVREEHEDVDGETFDWDDPPVIDGEAVIPGEPINCRCTAFPIIPELEGDDEDAGASDDDEAAGAKDDDEE